MPNASVKPYCIWYPDVASEETYRELARRYPDMRYQIGRACAVAGYATLHKELRLLPDISIAEEARDNGHTAIYEAIVSQDTRYAVMNDYTRTVNLESPRPGFLNGDTAVRSTLSGTRPAHELSPESQKISQRPFFYEGISLQSYEEHYFDIQEDAHINYFESDPQRTRLEDEFVDLLWNLLPRDLPTINKDALIVAAAWDGNADRYQRLRRPKTVPNELSAVIRGAHHHTPFARWLDACLDDTFDKDEALYVRQAVHARFIMNNDLSRINTETDGDELPAIFWWPHIPHENTLREFAWRRPDFKHQVTLACIVGHYQELFDELQSEVKPSQWQWEVACQSTNPHYCETVERRAAEEKVRLFHGPKSFNRPGAEGCWSRSYLRPNKEPSYSERAVMPKGIYNEPDEPHWELWDIPPGDLLNNGMQWHLAKWATHISATDDTRRQSGLLYSSDDDFERRKTPAPEPKLRKDFSSLDDLDYQYNDRP
ncbi:uncharacterized protein ColSpa_01930 [Colletotrichum spaethianum]|uniref:Uncharacterized protein n=1 Tax=Colletotrichum spaethianum TaxID=700344 RepID=A0AA37P729_9PEZI|nr:uncharacterized protein ColSpa_01930 [Colletotrichum spaethianum]GKT41749.1 hypothetical protein ColSpa_01930 [Colletotrichum spaethianum]